MLHPAHRRFEQLVADTLRAQAVSTPSIIRPPALRPGDTVAIAAVSSGMERELVGQYETGVAQIEGLGFRVVAAPLVEQQGAWWWGPARPAVVANELNGLFRDPEIRAIWGLVGGRFALSYLDLLDYEAIAANPKALIGMSDVGVLTFAIHARTGLVTFHADLFLYGVSEWPDLSGEDRARQVDAYRRVLTSTEAVGSLPALSTWETWRPGRAEGPLLGGMLNRVIKLQATEFALAPERFDGAILFLEDYVAPTINIWHDLQVLRHHGVFERIAGLVIGPVDGIPIQEGTVQTLREVVLDVVGERDIPVIGNVNCGHSGPNVPLPLGVRAAIDADALTISLLEPAVRHG